MRMGSLFTVGHVPTAMVVAKEMDTVAIATWATKQGGAVELPVACDF